MATTATHYENHLHDEEPRWFALYAAFKKEKYAEKLLLKKGIETFLPIQKIVRRYERKVRRLEVPLLSCYLFVKITKQEYVPVLETEYILNFIKFSNNLISIPEREIALLKRIVTEQAEVSVEKIELLEGDIVEIESGSLAGIQGKFVSVQGKNKVVIELQQIGYAFHLEVDKNILRKVSEGIVAVH